jgi:hypothetical protein
MGSAGPDPEVTEPTAVVAADLRHHGDVPGEAAVASALKFIRPLA